VKEIYFSTDGKPGSLILAPHSMLSFGSAAYLPDKTLVGTFSANLTITRKSNKLLGSAEEVKANVMRNQDLPIGFAKLITNSVDIQIPEGCQPQFLFGGFYLHTLLKGSDP
jgi:hypothetical protein